LPPPPNKIKIPPSHLRTHRSNYRTRNVKESEDIGHFCGEHAPTQRGIYLSFKLSSSLENFRRISVFTRSQNSVSLFLLLPSGILFQMKEHVVWMVFLSLVFSASGQETHSRVPPTIQAVDELRSAVAVSQLILAQQAQFFRELINITKSRNNCANARGSLEDSVCPYPFVKVVEECFYVSRTSLTWHAARHYCRGMGGDLATPSNLYGLKTHILEKRGPRILWIGGIDQGIDGGWQWVTGDAVENDDWSSNRPSIGKPTENCLGIRRDSHPALTNLPCHKSQFFVCQYRQ
ncbi:hypothetical protein SK128_026805, partial [Halocaridina rubra]